MNKSRNIVCVFAHPDDETLGPSGTITKWSQNNSVYIICVTDGENPSADTHSTFKIRSKEIKSSAKIMGVKKVFFLGYRDGELNNNCYHQVAADIEKILKRLKPQILLTYESGGVSGHIDHVFVSMVTSYLFQKLKFVKKIFYFAESKIVSDVMKSHYFIYFPDGYRRNEVDYIENVGKYQKTKIEAVKQHVSQKKDMDLILKKIKFLPKEEYFFVKERGVKTGLVKSTKTAKELTKALLRNLKKGRMG